MTTNQRRRIVLLGGCVLLVLLLAVIGRELAVPPINTCSECGRVMHEIRRGGGAPGDWLSVDYRCDCGRQGRLVVLPGEEPQWRDYR